MVKRVIRLIPNPIRVRGIACILGLLGLMGALPAQTITTHPTDGGTPPGLAPGAPAGSYALSGFETINLYSGKLHFRLPLQAVVGRGGAALTMMLPIEQLWQIERILDMATSDVRFVATDAWWAHSRPGYGPGVLQRRWTGNPLGRCISPPPVPGQYPYYRQALTRLTFTAPDGTEYELRDQLTGGQPLAPVTDVCDDRPPAVHRVPRGTVFTTADGSAATFVATASDENPGEDPTIYDYFLLSTPGSLTPDPSGYLMLRDGTRYRINRGLVTWMRDRNGNQLRFAYGAPTGQGTRVTGITDSLNRTVTIQYSTGSGSPDTITFNGFGGAPRTLQIGYQPLSAVLRPGSGWTIQGRSDLFPQTSYSPTPYNPDKVATVTLPDNRQFQFFYNPYGELARVVLPTGGAYEYDWAGGPGTDASGLIYVQDNYRVYRRVIERRVYPDGSTGSGYASRTTYSAATTGADPSFFTTVGVDDWDASGTRMASTRHSYYGSPTRYQSPIGYPAWSENKEYQTEHLDGDGTTVRRRVNQTWQQRAPVSWWRGAVEAAPPNDPRICQTLTTLVETNQVAGQVLLYDGYNNPTDRYEYDYGAAPPLTGVCPATPPAGFTRQTHTDYLTAGYDTNLDIHLRSLPLQQSVFDAGGVEQARTTYEYDNYTPDAYHAALTDRPGISGLDAGFTTAYATRGNVTGVSRWLLSSGTPLTSYSQYDIAGNVVRSVDAKGYATAFDFSDRFGSPTGEARSNTPPAELGAQSSYAWASSVTNARQQPSYTKRDYSTGQPVDSEDRNGAVTTQWYNDPLDRLTAVQRPDGGTTTYTYSPSTSPQVFVTETTAIRSTPAPALNQTRTTIYDGLGRPQTVVTNDPDATPPFDGQVYVDTRYDALGRVVLVSNPHYSSSTPTPVQATEGWTRTQYDALDRVVEVGTFAGREPPPASGTNPNWTGSVTTQYVGNQTIVTDPAGKVRRTLVDGLGRLVRVDEPDGTGDLGGVVTPAQPTLYRYDALDNLTAVYQGKTRTFEYDSLSRLQRVWNPEQVDAAGQRLATTYTYDANGNVLTRTDPRGIVTTYTYDELNRLTAKRYSDGTTPIVTYTYDQNANCPAPNYPVGRLGWVLVGSAVWTPTTVWGANYCYDSLGRTTGQTQWLAQANQVLQQQYNLLGLETRLTYPSLRTVTTEYSNAGRPIRVTDSVAGNLVSALQYAPQGGLVSETLRNGRVHTLSYNSRWQPLSLQLGLASNPRQDWSVDYNYGATNNNGNVQQLTLIPGSGQIPLVQSFEYDELNRLKRAVETQNGIPQWQQAFGYDRVGNRTVDVPNTTPALVGPVVGYTEPNRLWGRRWDGGQWWPWLEREDGRLQEAPAGTTYGGLWQVFARGMDDNLYQTASSDGLSWSAWQGLGRPAPTVSLRSGPAAGAYRGQLYVFVRGSDDQLWYRTSDGQSWSSWTAIAGILRSAPAVTAYADGSLRVYAQGWDGALYELVSADGIAWPGPWNRLDGRLLSAPAAVTYGNQLYVFARSTGDSLYFRRFDPPPVGWSGWTLMPGVVIDAPAATIYNGSLQVYIRGQDNGLYQTVLQADGTWSPWTALRGTLVSGPAAVSYGNQLYVWAQGNASSTNQITTTGYGYDAAGNLVSDPNTTYRYDAENRLTQVGPGGATAAYAYDAAGRRIQSTVGGVVTAYLYDTDGRLLGEYNGATLSKLYYYRGNQVVATQDLATNTYKYWTTDHLGSVRVISDGSGAVVSRRDFLPFGEELAASLGGRSGIAGYGVSEGTRQKFTGKERDAESGQDYFSARYYASRLGRFMSMDPAMASGRVKVPQSWNRYTYTLNNPLRFIDIEGLIEADPNVVVVVFGGGNASINGLSNIVSSATHMSTTSVTSMVAGGSTKGIGEESLDDYEAQNIAQQIKNDFPNVEVKLGGPDSHLSIFNDLATNKPSHIIIEGYSSGATAAIGLTNNLTRAGQRVDQLTTVDPPRIGKAFGIASIQNPGLVKDAVNFVGPDGVSIKGAKNIPITNADIQRRNTTVLTHKTADDITSPKVIQRIGDKIREIMIRFKRKE